MNLRYELSDHIGIFTLDNPPVNVWTPELHKRFFELLSDFLSDDEAHVGILTSSGDRAFSAGDDLKTPDLHGARRACRALPQWDA